MALFKDADKRIPTPHLTLQYNGLFDFDGFYAALIEWAKHYGYMWHERDYKHKVPSPEGAEQEWKWTMTKKIDAYIQYDIMMEAHAWDMLEVEVNVEGKKKILNNARLSIKMHGVVTTDWQNRFTKTSFSRTLGNIYYGARSHDISGIYWDTLVYRINNLHHIIKGYFDMQTKKYAFKGYLGEH